MPNSRYLGLLALVAVALALYFGRTDPRINVLVSPYLAKLQPSAAPAPHTPRASASNVPGAFTRKIVAIGDLHGDLPNALKVLHMAGVTDEHGDWAGAIDFLVQTGDIVDRGDDTIKLYMLMEKLREQAHRAGAEVLSHLGNHEWMNAVGDWRSRYVYPSEIETFGSVAARQKMLSTGRIGRAWAQNYTSAGRLPLHPSLGPPNTDYAPPAPGSGAAQPQTPLSHAALSFVHGGLAPAYPQLTPYPSAINALGTTLLAKLHAQTPHPPPHPPHAYPALPPGTTRAEERFVGGDGPLWYRGWAVDPEREACAKVDAVLAQIGARRMIMGHTPNMDEIVSRCGGKIIIIDTGISHAYGGALSALSIEYTLAPVSGETETGGEREWQETEVVTAIYEKRRDVLALDERRVFGEFALS
ncbi:Metallo-dependent phosphatase [Athelia psychrophila]|uniref:Metallo-dependent phosphatase n=1 Tax=Athelia psychrophila TaxID=1759441 RepID=A0A166LCN7_9AGAM|nr:Metallo-dependent phosphatase [Fibularhizoctonia sp. CBS 109695]